MAITTVLPRPGSYQNLQPHQRAAIDVWLRSALGGVGSKVGLWVYGNRAEGSSYVGSVAVKKIANDVGIENWEYSTALDLMDRIRISWSADQVSRGNANDYDLYVEAAAFDDSLTDFWNKKLVWIDDVYSTLDMAFWHKHVMERVLQRVKSGLPTIVCLDMSPADRQFEGLEKLIKTWFVTCYAER